MQGSVIAFQDQLVAVIAKTSSCNSYYKTSVCKMMTVNGAFICCCVEI